MDPFDYIKILEEALLPYANEEMSLKWVFQQDSCPERNSKRAASCFQTRKVNITALKARILNPNSRNAEEL